MEDILKTVLNTCPHLLSDETHFVIPGKDDDFIISIETEGKPVEKIHRVRSTLVDYKSDELIVITPVGYVKIENYKGSYSIEVKIYHSVYNMSQADFNTIMEYADDLLGRYNWYYS